MQKLKEYRKLAVVALLASALTAAPISIYAHAQGNDQENPVVEMIENGTEEEQPAEEEPETLPPPKEGTPQAEEEAPVEEDEEPTPPVETAVDILDAITIAKAAHDEVAGESSEVIMAQVKLKKLHDEKVFKVVFADGWRMYIRASDGEIVLMKDASNKERKCGDRGRHAVAAWRSAFNGYWGYQPARGNYSKPKHHARKPQPQHYGGWDWSWQQHIQQHGGQQPEQDDNAQEQESAGTEVTQNQ